MAFTSQETSITRWQWNNIRNRAQTEKSDVMASLNLRVSQAMELVLFFKNQITWSSTVTNSMSH